MNHLSKTIGCVLLAAAMTGCTTSPGSTSGGPGSDPVPSTSSPTQPTEDPTEEPTGEPTPTVAPATGDTIKVKGMSVNTPGNWEAGPATSLQASGFPRASGVGTIMTLFRFTQIAGTLDEVARENSTRTDWATRLKRRKDLTVDGQEVVHVAGRSNPGQYVEIFSTLLDGEQLDLNFIFGRGESRAERGEIVQSVLATWEFTG